MSLTRRALLGAFVLVSSGLVADVTRAEPPSLAALPGPPAELVAKLHLSPKYTKHLDEQGLPILGTSAVNDAALREAQWVIHHMIGHRSDVLGAIAKQGIRVVVMAKTEMTTDVPEHADLTPAPFWNRRARGLGATLQRPATSCAEENLLEIQGDPYATENILVHEFGHTVHELGMSVVDPTFDTRLAAAYAHAQATGLWAGTYAMQNRKEYWAEATQSWFDTNRANDAEHGPIDTRAKLVGYDPQVAALLREVYGDGPWRYKRPSLRAEAERAHLAGFDARNAGRFVWPASAPPIQATLATPASLLTLLPPEKLPSASPPSSGASTLVFANQRKRDVAVDWIDFKGMRKRYLVLRPGKTHVQTTYAGHVWLFSEDGNALGGVVAGAGEARVELR